jgi:hypothetical protein
MSIRKIKSFIAKLAKLKSEIETEKKAVGPDWLRLRHLKKIKLGIKEQIARLVLKTQYLQYIPPQDRQGLHRYKRPEPRRAPQPRNISVRG